MRQLFVRFSGCSLTCDYCDTPESRVRGSEFRVHKGTVPDLRTERSRGVESGLSPTIHTFPNPVSSEKLTEIVNSFRTHPNLHHSISLTGGEPLEQVDFLKEWLQDLHNVLVLRHPLLDKEGVGGSSELSPLKIYLETNGILSSHLSEVIDLIDIIGMDIKLPSVAGVKPSWELHREFLRVASRKEVFVKVVVDSGVTEEDMINAVNLVSSLDNTIPFVIQPKTPIDMTEDRMLNLQERASLKLSQVRMIPQLHKLLNMA